MARRSDLSFRQEMKFRNKLVEYLSEWVLHASTMLEEVLPEVLAISLYVIFLFLGVNAFCFSFIS